MKNNIIEKVTARITSGEVYMRSRALFALRSFAIVLLGFVALFTSILIINFILFSIHLNSHETLLDFGPRGWAAFFRFFPWPLFIIDMLCIGGLSILLKQFRFGYKTPLLYVFGGIVAFSLLCSFVVERHTPANEFFMRGVEGKMLPPPMKGIMSGMRKPPNLEDGVCVCDVVEVTDAYHMTLRDSKTGKLLTVIVNEDAYATPMQLSVGERVFIAGEYTDGLFTVFGLKRVDRREPFPRPMMRE